MVWRLIAFWRIISFFSLNLVAWCEVISCKRVLMPAPAGQAKFLPWSYARLPEMPKNAKSFAKKSILIRWLRMRFLVDSYKLIFTITFSQTFAFSSRAASFAKICCSRRFISFVKSFVISILRGVRLVVFRKSPSCSIWSYHLRKIFSHYNACNQPYSSSDTSKSLYFDMFQTIHFRKSGF
jgi:hypothetical protein